LKSKISLGLFVLVVLIAGVGASSSRPVGAKSDPILFTAAPSYISLAWIQGGERFPSGATLYYRDSQSERKLFPEFEATADANVSFDATRLLFAGKRSASDAWQIWEASFDGSAPHQLTHSATGAVRPFYLPGDRFVYSALKNNKYVLMSATLDGSGEQQISFSDSNVLATDVLRDGRILIQSAVSNGGTPQPEVFVVYSDGSGFESIRCDHGASRYAGHELSSWDIVFTHGGKLAHFSSPFATEKPVSLPTAHYPGEIAETSSHQWIFASAPTSNEKFSLRVWTPGTSATAPLVSINSQNVVQPVMRVVRQVPKKHPSALHDWKYANLLALNVYESKLAIADHSVASVSVYTRDSAGNEKRLGSAPVESDGSFFVRVPAEQPIRFELSDAKGNSIVREKSWFWTRGGEQRICVGCHAGPERAPDNAVPMVLEKSTEPVDLTQSLTTNSGGH
jgi:hypothetical protein